MKTLTLAIAGTVLFLSVVRATQSDQTFTGEIMDSKCANSGSHAEVMKDRENLHTAKECTLACKKDGANLVLFNAITKVVYQLDDQNKSMQFAGASVTIAGTLDDATKTIHGSDIALVPTPSTATDPSH